MCKPSEQQAYHLICHLADGKSVSRLQLLDSLQLKDSELKSCLDVINAWGVVVAQSEQRIQLKKPMQLLDLSYLQSSLNSPIELFPIIGSTNQYLLDQVGHIEQGQVCTAEYQAQGRGRRGKQWLSPFGSNLYISMYWPLQVSLEAVMGVSLVIGIAVVDALTELGAKDVKVKWPNDIYLNNKKLAGILIESKGQSDAGVNLVVGMGMNVQATQDNQIIDQPWSSLEQAFVANMPDRNTLLVHFINAWQQALQRYQQQGMAPFIERWPEVDNFFGQNVKLIIEEKEVFGVMKGIDAQGAALVETEQGVIAFYGNEISLRSADHC